MGSNAATDRNSRRLCDSVRRLPQIPTIVRGCVRPDIGVFLAAVNPIWHIIKRLHSLFRRWAKVMRVPANPPASRQPLVIGQMVQHPAGKIIGDHVHSEGQLSVVLKGTMGIRCKGGWWLAPAGRGIWIPSGMEHSAIYSERASFVLLKVTPLAGALPPSVRSIGVSDFLKELSIEIARPASRQVNDDGALISALIVRRLCDAKATPMLFLPSGNDPRVLRVTEFLRSNPANTASFDKLAKMAGSSRRTLSRLFLAD